MQNGEGKFCIFVEVWKNEETMMEFKDRRSIRKYSRRRLPDGQIEALAEEASRAATMGNMQLYSLVVTTDADVQEREALAEAHHHQPMVEEAPAVLTFCADFHRFSRWCEERKAEPGYGNFVSFIHCCSHRPLSLWPRSADSVPAFSAPLSTIRTGLSRPCICRT